MQKPCFLNITAKMSKRSVSLLDDINSSQSDTESLVREAFAEVGVSSFRLNAPEERVVERGQKSPVGGPEGPIKNVCDTEAIREADMEHQGVGVVGGVAEVGVSRHESEGFTLSKICRRKRLSKRIGSEGFIDTSHLTQSKFLKP